MEELSQVLHLPSSPKPITLINAITLRCIKTDSTVPTYSDLPRYMLKKIMLLDRSSRQLPTVDAVSSKDDTSASLFPEDDEEDGSIHPMDIFLYLFSTSAPIFRQTIITQLSKCQLSLPLITHNSDKNEFTLNCFAFKALVLNRFVGGNDTRCFSVLEEPLPIVSFIRVGKCGNNQKSKLLNIILNVGHEYFSTREVPGSTVKRFLLNGTFEVAWYLPNYNGNDNIDHNFVMLNLRGDATLYPKQTTFIGEISTIVYVFVPLSEVTRDLVSQLEEYRNKFKSKVIFLVYMTTKLALDDIPEFLKDKDKSIGLKLKTLGKDSIQISKSISNNLADKQTYTTLSQCIQVAKKIGIRTDIEQDSIESLEELVASVCKEFPLTIDKSAALANVKSKFLPLQGYFRVWSDCNRELQLMVSGSNSSNNPKKKQKEIRSSQLKTLSKPSILLKGILDQCCKLSPDEINIFFELLKERLNEISRMFLPILYDQYKTLLMDSNPKKSESATTEDDSKQQKVQDKLSKAADCIMRSSFGIEHIFRELGQVYEAHCFSDENSSVNLKLNYSPTLLPVVVARLILQGHSFEIVNGDDNHVPLTWIPDVLNKLSDIVGRDKKLFVVSVLGIQSSGKSTLLNAMFGVNFPVSSGRCTRGVFLQVIPIEQELRSQIGYDFLFVLDTEGLRAAELSGSISYKQDNEMATFIVGISDLAIINIKGENNSELQDILQISIIAFMRMKTTLKKPRCMFVHQNVGDIQAKGNLMIARKKFIDLLNEMTVCAALQENKEFEFSKFCDLIEFNPEEDVLYFPGLFEGEPPMTSVSSGYVGKARELRGKILSCQGIQFHDMKEWSLKLLDIWNSVIKENFVFSYKNILEVNCRIELDRALCSWHSEFILDMISVKSDFISRLYNAEYYSLEATLQQIVVELDTKVAETKSQSDEVVDRFFIQHGKKAIFEQWKNNSEQFFIDCKDKEKKRIIDDCETIFKVVKQKQEIDETFIYRRNQIFAKVRELFVNFRGHVSFDVSGSVDTLFNNFWKEWKASHKKSHIDLSDIPSDMQQMFLESQQLKQLDVFSTRQELLTDTHSFKELGEGNLDIISTRTSSAQVECNYYRVLDYQYENYIWGVIVDVARFFKRMFGFGKHQDESGMDDVERRFLSISTDQYRFINRFISKIHEDANYDKNYFTMIINQCINLITEHNRREKITNARQSIILTNYYIFDFTFYQCCKTIKHFEHLQSKFFEKHSLEEQFDKLKSTIKENFLQLCEGVQSEKLCSAQLASITLNGMKEHLKDTVIPLFHKLFVNDPEHGTIYSSRPSLQLSVLKELAKKKDFNAYISYINSPFSYFDAYILKSIRDYSKKHYVVSNILADIHRCTDEFRTQCAEITNVARTQGIYTFAGWKPHFHKSIIPHVKGVRLSDLDILDIHTVTNLQQFSELFLQSLKNSIDELDWKHWIGEILTNSEFLAIKENIMNSLVGRKALCPFCKEPCQLSAGKHEHYCGIFHRPQGISGWRHIESNIIAKEECTTDILRKKGFIYEGKEYKYEDYRTVNEYFNSWRILGQDSIDSNYWQWVLCTFQKEFVKHYRIKPNEEINKDWSHLTEKDIIDDIDKLYQRHYSIDKSH